MSRFVRSATHWVGGHAFPVLVAAVIAVGAAGGGIGYAVASPRSTAAPAAPSATSPRTPAPSAAKGRKPAGAEVGGLFSSALHMLATQTGQTVASVRGQLEAGKSVDAIAGAKAPAVESEILSAITKLADRAVKMGRIPAAQEPADLALAKTKVEALMKEPGTQLIKDAQKALQFLQTHGTGKKGAGAAPTASPSPAA
jgi:hypothetical protein